MIRERMRYLSKVSSAHDKMRIRMRRWSIVSLAHDGYAHTYVCSVRAKCVVHARWALRTHCRLRPGSHRSTNDKLTCGTVQEILPLILFEVKTYYQFRTGTIDKLYSAQNVRKSWLYKNYECLLFKSIFTRNSMRSMMSTKLYTHCCEIWL